MSDAIPAYADPKVVDKYKVYRPEVGFVNSYGYTVQRIEELSKKQNKDLGNKTMFPSLRVAKFKAGEYIQHDVLTPYIIRQNETFDMLTKRIRKGFEKEQGYREVFPEVRILRELLDCSGIRKEESEELVLKPEDVLYGPWTWIELLNTGIFTPEC